MLLRNILMRESKPIELNGNSPLPRWLNCDISDGVCYMWGIPNKRDDPEIKIRVIDDALLVIESFKIVIQKNNDSGNMPGSQLGNDDENQSLIKKS